MLKPNYILQNTIDYKTKKLDEKVSIDMKKKKPMPIETYITD